MRSDPGSADKPAARRWTTWLLALSLTANLAVLGAIAGAHVRDGSDARRFPPPDRATMRDSGFAPFFDAMPREARNRMGEAMRGRIGGFEPDRAALAAELREMLAVLRAEPFEPARLEALMAAQQARVAERVAAGRGVLVEQVAAMSPAERAGFAAELERRFTRALEHGAAGAAPRHD